MTPDRNVLAALDDSDAAVTVARIAQGVGTLFDREVQAINVRENGGRTARDAAAFAGLPVETVDGDVIATLLARAGKDTIIVLGSSDRPRTGEPTGHVARELMTQLATPIVVVPPGATLEPNATTLLVPMDGSTASRRTLEAVIDVVGDSGCEYTAVHVLDDVRLPAFSDQVQHEAEAWTQEFRDRHCVDVAPVHLEVRVGAPAEQVLRVADEHHAAIIVVGWSRHLDAGRAQTLRELLLHSTRPLLLLSADPR